MGFMTRLDKLAKGQSRNESPNDTGTLILDSSFSGSQLCTLEVDDSHGTLAAGSSGAWQFWHRRGSGKQRSFTAYVLGSWPLNASHESFELASVCMLSRVLVCVCV